MFDFGYLEKFINFLQERDPYSNVYAGLSVSLRNAIINITKLERQIFTEVKRFKERNSKD